jgi:hypothetical protein
MSRRAPAPARFVQATARGATAFYDIDTPVTLAKLARGDFEYLSSDVIPGFDRYLSFTGEPTLRQIECQYGARSARPLYCSVDPALYRPCDVPTRWDLTGSRPWRLCRSSRRGAALDYALPSPDRNIPTTLPGPTMSSASSICPRPSTRGSTARRG